MEVGQPEGLKAFGPLGFAKAYKQQSAVFDESDHIECAYTPATIQLTHTARAI